MQPLRDRLQAAEATAEAANQRAEQEAEFRIDVAQVSRYPAHFTHHVPIRTIRAGYTAVVLWIQLFRSKVPLVQYVQFCLLLS